MILAPSWGTISIQSLPEGYCVPWKRLTKIHYRCLFVYGAFMTIIAAALIGSVSDYLIGNRGDIAIDLIYGLLAGLAFWRAVKTEKITVAAVQLFWIATSIECIYLYIHRVDFDLIFAILIPLIAFIALPTRLIVLNLTLFYLLLVAFLVTFAAHDPANLFLHNDKYMVGYALAHFFMVSFGFFYHFAIEESLKRLEQSNREKTLLLREVHHRVKNNLNFIAAILGLQARSPIDPAARTILEHNRHRIESIALLHNILYRSDTLGSLDTRTYLQLLTRSLIDTVGEEVPVDLHCTVTPAKLEIDTLMHLGILINELMTNSLKYATESDGHIRITITFAREGDSAFRLHYCDGGKTELPLLKEGFGYSLIRMTVRQLGGTLTTAEEKGLCYTIRFPHTKEAA